jgi:hypothetical protein
MMMLEKNSDDIIKFVVSWLQKNERNVGTTSADTEGIYMRKGASVGVTLPRAGGVLTERPVDAGRRTGQVTSIAAIQ